MDVRAEEQMGYTGNHHPCFSPQVIGFRAGAQEPGDCRRCFVVYRRSIHFRSRCVV